MNHFLDIQSLSLEEVRSLIERAMYFKHHPLAFPRYPQHIMVPLFYEKSTRTRVSFEVAAGHLGVPVIPFDTQQSSESKGEMIEDTFKTLMSMGCSVFVVRHVKERLPHALARQCVPGVHVINAGDGAHAHPSQALLDMMTILEQKPNLSQLKIAMVGDLRHSRVAASLQWLCALLGVGELALVAPTVWQPSVLHYGHVTTSLKEGLANADVVIGLRVQQERLLASEQMDLALYRREYALTREHLAFAKKEAMVMHPGPINRGIEIDSDVADGPQSFILEQVKNGVFMRMAILDALLSSV